MAKSGIWKNPQLRRIIFASIPADFADWLDYVAIAALLAYTWQSGPWALAFFAIALGSPYLVVGPFAGAMIDRGNLRAVLILSNLGRAATTAALVFAPNVGVLLTLVFVRGAIDSTLTPARQATIQALADEDLRDETNAIVHGISQLSKIAGPAIGGMLLVWLAPQSVFVINALISLIAAAIIWNIVIPEGEFSEPDDGGNLLVRVLAGFAEVKNNSKLLMGISFVAVSLFAVFLYDTFLVLLALDYGFEVRIYGLSIAAVGAGGVIGALAIARTKIGNRHLGFMALGSIVSGLIVAGLGIFAIFELQISDIIYVAGFFLIGICVAFVQIPYRSLLQLEVSADKLPRVVATGEAISVIAMLSAPIIGGFLVFRFSVGAPFAVGGVLLVVIGIFGLLRR